MLVGEATVCREFDDGQRARYDLRMSHDNDLDFDSVLNPDCGCGCGRRRRECRDLRKLAKHTHVAGANCCSGFANVFTKRRGCR